MRKILYVLLAALPVLVFAGPVEIRSRIGPTFTAGNVTIAAAGAGRRNCLTDLDASSDADYTLRVLDGGTTAYTVIASSGSVLIRSWDEGSEAMCGTANTALYVNVSGGNAAVNHKGFVY